MKWKANEVGRVHGVRHKLTVGGHKIIVFMIWVAFHFSFQNVIKIADGDSVNLDMT